MAVYEAVVVGAGPGGLATTAALLDAGLSSILWIDPTFGGGRLNELYREISSNTKVGIYLDAIHSSPTCRRIVDGTARPNAVSRLEEMGRDETCQLELAGDMVMLLLEGLLALPGVDKLVDEVEEARFEPQEAAWKVKAASPNALVSATQLHLCTGSHPICTAQHTAYNPNLITLDLDECLRASHLPSLLPTDSHATVAVIGNSHSGVLACRNLCELAHDTSHSASTLTSSHSASTSTSESTSNTSTPCGHSLSILNFRRGPIKFAEYRNDGIVWDNSGLKGATAEWAKAVLVDSTSAEPVPTLTPTLTPTPAPSEGATGNRSPNPRDSERILRQIDLGTDESSVYAEYLPRCTHIIYAIGYTPSPLPRLYLGGTRIDQNESDHDHDDHDHDHDHDHHHDRDRKGNSAHVPQSGRLAFDQHSSGFTFDGQRVTGLYGAGIAFPEQVEDPEGHVEAAVGVAKFFKFTQRVKGDWARVR